MSPLFSMFLDYALHLDLIWRCKDTNYFSFHQIFPQLFSPFPKHLTFPPLAFNISPPPTFFVHRLSQIYTDYFFGTEIHGFILNKDTAGSALIFPRHFVITACFASSRLSLLFCAAILHSSFFILHFSICGLYEKITRKTVKYLVERKKCTIFAAVTYNI